MATVAHPPAAPRLVLRGLSWPTYLALRDAPENYHIRMTYDQGAVEMMWPSKRHDKLAVLIDRMIQVWTEELSIDIGERSRGYIGYIKRPQNTTIWTET